MHGKKIEVALAEAEYAFTDADRLAKEGLLYKNSSPADLQRANTEALTSIAVSLANIGKLFAAVIRNDLENKTSLSISTS